MLEQVLGFRASLLERACVDARIGQRRRVDAGGPEFARVHPSPHELVDREAGVSEFARGVARGDEASDVQSCFQQLVGPVPLRPELFGGMTGREQVLDGSACPLQCGLVDSGRRELFRREAAVEQFLDRVVGIEQLLGCVAGLSERAGRFPGVS